VDLNGKVAIVTGAARGLGREYVCCLAAAGAAVIAADQRDCSETVTEVEASGGRALGLELDVADSQSTQAMADAAVETFGRIDVLINNAALYGSLKGGRFEDITDAEWDACMAVNVKGIWNCCKAVVPVMRKAAVGGSIINISSLAAVYGTPFTLHYATSKAAVIGITRSLARELGRDWIRVNTIAPSCVLTDGTDEFFGAKSDRAKQVIAAGQALQKNLKTSDLAGTVLYLASDASRFVTGQTIMVDGGTVLL
jgi:NAD(P)-dependent dehydrogenase (short-subunit alcohol dehydrogenase family)